MGEAKRRRLAGHDLEGQMSALDQQGQTIVGVSRRVTRLLVKFGGGACYRSTCFLYLFLKETHGLQGEAIVGFVNDGTDDLYAPHAWYEFDGRKTDLALLEPMYPEIQKRGALLIHGIEFKSGHPYTYYRELPPEGMQSARRLLADPDARDFNDRHRLMSDTITDDRLIRRYLDGAPDGWSYDRMAAWVRSAPAKSAIGE